MGCTAGKPGKVKQNQQSSIPPSGVDAGEVKSQNKIEEKQENNNNAIEDTKAEENEKKANSPEELENNNNSNKIEKNQELQQQDIKVYDFQVPQQFISTPEIDIEQKWIFLIGQEVNNQLLYKYNLKVKDKQNYNQLWLLEEVQNILGQISIKTDEQRVILIRKAIDQTQKYQESYDHREDKTVQKIGSQIYKEFQEWLPLIYMEASSMDINKNSLQSLTEISFVSLFYINNIYNQQKEKLLHHHNQQNKSIQPQEIVPYICFKDDKDTDQILKLIAEIKKKVTNDYPYIIDYKVRQHRDKIQATVFLNELYTGVQRQCRKNKSPFEISNDYLDDLYNNTIINMGEIVPQDDYNHLGHCTKKYQYPQLKNVITTRQEQIPI